MEKRDLDVHKSLHYLATTDEQYANAKAAVKATEHILKVIKAKAVLEAEGAVTLREQTAYASDAYQAKLAELKDFILESETLGAKRRTAELAIEVWRSLNSNRRQAGGNM